MGRLSLVESCPFRVKHGSAVSPALFNIHLHLMILMTISTPKYAGNCTQIGHVIPGQSSNMQKVKNPVKNWSDQNKMQ